MREILFRGQTRKYGEKVKVGDGQKLPGHWVHGGILQGSGDFSIIYTGSEAEDFEKLAVYSDTVGQYTEITDKNDTKIFEGDIVKAVGKTKTIIGKVEYISWHGAWMIIPDTSNEDLIAGRLNHAINLMDEGRTKWRSYEVIGNIHDNPELLTGAAPCS